MNVGQIGRCIRLGQCLSQDADGVGLFPILLVTGPVVGGEEGFACGARC